MLFRSRGAWALDEAAPEAEKGFLLNHLIHELLPPKGDGLRWSNSDPITGQAVLDSIAEAYDMAALAPIVTEAGGRFSSLDGVDGPFGGSAVSSNGVLHEAAIAALAGNG